MPRKSNLSRRRFLKKAATAAYAAPLIVSLPANASMTRCGSGRQARAKTAITPGLGHHQSKWSKSKAPTKSSKAQRSALDRPFKHGKEG